MQNCLATRYLAKLTTGFVFVNLGATISASMLVYRMCILLNSPRSPVIIIVLLATTPLHEMHSGPYVFGSQGIINETNGWPDGLAFLFGLLSVQWTMTVRYQRQMAEKLLRYIRIMTRQHTYLRRSAGLLMLLLRPSSSLLLAPAFSDGF